MKTIFKFLLVIVVLVLIITPNYAVEKKEQINIIITPCFDKVMAYNKFYPIVSYLKNQTGIDVNLLVPKNIEEIKSDLKNNKASFVLHDPHMYITFESYFRKDSVLQTLSMSGETSQYGLFIARKGNKIDKISDLKGKTVMFGPILSSVKWLAAKKTLKDNGIDIDKDLKSYSHGTCCEDIAFNVFIGGVDAGVICKRFLDEHPHKQKEFGIDEKQLVIIGKTQKVPTRIFAAHKSTPTNIIEKINSALLALNVKNPKHKEILYAAELGGFKKAVDSDYDDLRKMSKHK